MQLHTVNRHRRVEESEIVKPLFCSLKVVNNGYSK